MRTSHRIALAYLILSALWILLSDKLFYALFPDYFPTISLYKGWAFVAASALVLFIFLRREERRRDNVESQLQHTSISDPLTGLRNRAALISHVEHALRTAKRTHGSFGLIFIDVDNFQTVNDTLGHTAGDHLLRAIADRISTTIRNSDIAARFGSDEFVIFANNDDDLSVLAYRLLDAFSDPLDLDGLEQHTAISIGIARYPEHGATADEILNSANKAMFNAKSAGKGCVREA